jgi:hypothetical protein
MLTDTEVNALGNIVNSSFGRSSTDTFSCKALFEGNKLRIMYSTTAYFASERDMHFQQARLGEESNKLVAEFVKRIKDQFKEDTSTTLKLDQVSDKDTLELVNASMNNPRRVFVYRRFAEFEILNGGK